MTVLDGADCTLFMRYSKVFPSAQGMAIHGDDAYILYHTGHCAVYHLPSRQAQPVAVFPLGSYNVGVPTEEHANHANQAMFGGRHYAGNPIPLLYVTAGNGTGADGRGFYYHCAVESITRTVAATGGAACRSEVIQTIHYRAGGEAGRWERPCWGCPAFFADTDNDALYLFSARYRTTGEPPKGAGENAYIITKFTLPQAGCGDVTLTGADITGQFTAPFDILFTQGGTLRNGHIFYTFGYGTARYPIGLRVYDLARQRLAARCDLSRSPFAGEEIECCAFYGDRLLCNTNSGTIFEVPLNLTDLI